MEWVPLSDTEMSCVAAYRKSRGKDLTSLLVLADMLDESGDPFKMARAQLIRAECDPAFSIPPKTKLMIIEAAERAVEACGIPKNAAVVSFTYGLPKIHLALEDYVNPDIQQKLAKAFPDLRGVEILCQTRQDAMDEIRLCTKAKKLDRNAFHSRETGMNTGGLIRRDVNPFIYCDLTSQLCEIDLHRTLCETYLYELLYNALSPRSRYPAFGKIRMGYPIGTHADNVSHANCYDTLKEMSSDDWEVQSNYMDLRNRFTGQNPNAR